MPSTNLTRVLTALFEALLHNREKLTLEKQRLVLAMLAYSDVFPDPVKSLLSTAAEVAGDTDDILVEKLHDHRQWRRAAQKEAQDPPDSGSTCQ